MPPCETAGSRVANACSAPAIRVAAPLAGGPERALRVAGVALFGADKVQRARAERRRVAQNVARGLRPRQADDQRDRLGRGGGRCFLKRKRDRRRIDGRERGLAARPVDHAGVEGVSDAAAQDVEDVPRPPVAERQRPIDFGGSEEDEVHARGRIQATGPVTQRERSGMSRMKRSRFMALVMIT